MEDKEGGDQGADFTSDTSWTLAGPDSVSDCVNYFLDRESSILKEFGWNLQPDHAEEIERFSELERTDIRSDLKGKFSSSQSCGALAAAAAGSSSGTASNPGGSVDVSTSNPSVSSSSSEDLAEKSTGSGGKPPEIP